MLSPSNQRWQARRMQGVSLGIRALGSPWQPHRHTCQQPGCQHLKQGRKYSHRLSAAEDEQVCHTPLLVGSLGGCYGGPVDLVIKKSYGDTGELRVPCGGLGVPGLLG